MTDFYNKLQSRKPCKLATRICQNDKSKLAMLVRDNVKKILTIYNPSIAVYWLTAGGKDKHKYYICSI